MHRVSPELKKLVVENIIESLEGGEEINVLVVDIELYSDSQPDIIESMITRAIQDYKGVDFIRIFDVEYSQEKDSFILWYMDIEKEIITEANKKYGISEDDKYDLLFELGLESLVNSCDKHLAFLYDSEVTADEVRAGIKEN